MANYPNMSYCMYENTLSALNQVISDLEERDGIYGLDEYGKKLSDVEFSCAAALISRCKKIVEEFDLDHIPEK